MFPIRDNIPSGKRPFAVWLLISLNCLAFYIELRLPEATVKNLFYAYGLVPSQFFRYREVYGSFDYVALVSCLFLHGSWLHIIANMWSLLIFGDNIEARMGSVKFLIFYLLCGLASNSLHLVANPLSTIPAVGASGAIAGVLGAYFVLYPFARIETLIPVLFWPVFIEIPAFFFLGLWFLSQFISATTAVSQDMSMGGIAWWAHVGGFLAGIASYWIFLRPRSAY